MKGPARRAAWGVVAVLGVFVAFTMVKAVLAITDGGRRGTPESSALLPLPAGATVVDDRSYESEGSLGGGRRVLVVSTKGSRRPAVGVAEAYLSSLAERGWRRPAESGALSPDSSICLTAVTMEDYLGDEERPDDTKRWIRSLGQPVEITAVVSAIFC